MTAGEKLAPPAGESLPKAKGFSPGLIGIVLVVASPPCHYDCSWEVGKLATLSERTKSRISLLFLFLTFEAGIVFIAKVAPGLRLDPFTWIMLIFAAGLGGAGLAYMAIGDFIRWPLTKEVPHSSNANMIEVEPRYEGWLKSPGVLLCCPICAATWVGAGLLGLMAINYNVGYYTVLALSIGGAARVVIRLAEMLEWQSRYAQERTAQLNRHNALEEAARHEEPSYHISNGKTVWVVKDDEPLKEEIKK
jgi:hypothetical protein